MRVPESFYTTVSHHYGTLEHEPVNCDACGGADHRSLGQEAGYDIRKCVHCGLVYVHPQPVAACLPEFYEGMYDGAGEADSGPRSLGYVEPHIRRILLRRKPEGGRLFEIGCGHGALLAALRNDPWRLTASEVSEVALAAARERVPEAEFLVGAVEDLEPPPEPQDCIVMVAVLEHVKRPGATLRRVMDWLAPGGLLVVQVPYIQHFFKLKRAIPALPICFEAPRHLHDYAPFVLRRYYEQAGLAGIQADIARPYASPSPLATACIWGVKLPGMALHWLTRGRWIYPFASAYVMHGIRS